MVLFQFYRGGPFSISSLHWPSLPLSQEVTKLYMQIAHPTDLEITQPNTDKNMYVLLNIFPNTCILKCFSLFFKSVCTELTCMIDDEPSDVQMKGIN